ncbi:C-type mannose receptor 2-like [Fundulus heteroclitus]|uniref:C-type mannose receptor 2-like n=1 Tax=Fundulus heteroclitus TaxID=8078 RepID=UPI00165AF5D2|nr:C-type mannose receptor 2-like [Fundulus heteroclitus]
MTDMKRLLSNSAGDMREAWIGLHDPPGVQRTWYWSLPGEEFNEKTNTTQKYHLIREKKTWQKAQSYCRENHTDLVSGLKQLQDGEVEEMVKSVGENTAIFIGLFRDTWRWSDGSSFSFRHWNTDKVILIKESKTWEEALYYCRDHHHDLVTITNLDEQRWVQEKAKNASTDYVWMGLRYTCTLDFWFWVSGKVVSYKNWAPERLMDDCDMSGAMKTGGKHQWFKRNDSEELNFICFKR